MRNNGQFKHGKCNTRLYRIWRNMKNRCDSESCPTYHRYGGRGIKVCGEWYDFITFYQWAEMSGYEEDLTLDRIDNDKGYNPDNCKWSTMSEQSLNTSRNVNIEINGITKTLTEWSKETGINKKTLQKRYNRGDRGNKLLRTPEIKFKSKYHIGLQGGNNGSTKVKKNHF